MLYCDNMQILLIFWLLFNIKWQILLNNEGKNIINVDQIESKLYLLYNQANFL